jgi:hypothetical protein
MTHRMTVNGEMLQQYCNYSAIAQIKPAVMEKASVR